MHEIRVDAGGTNFLRLTIYGRRFPDSTDYWDGNWLNCDVEVAAGAFLASLAGTIRNEDVERFRIQLIPLYEHLTGTATLEALEGWLCLDLIGDGRGHIEAQGQLVDDPNGGNSLEFRFDLDQTYLPAIKRQSDEVFQAYPVVGRRE